MKQILIVALVAVAMLGGGELPILHAPQLAEAHAFAHQHMQDHALHADAVADDEHDHSAPPGSDHGIAHVHAHCCAAMAILTAIHMAPPPGAVAPLRFERNGAIPYGQLSYPPLRPPRLTA